MSLFGAKFGRKTKLAFSSISQHEHALEGEEFKHCKKTAQCSSVDLSSRPDAANKAVIVVRV